MRWLLASGIGLFSDFVQSGSTWWIPQKKNGYSVTDQEPSSVIQILIVLLIRIPRLGKPPLASHKTLQNIPAVTHQLTQEHEGRLGVSAILCSMCQELESGHGRISFHKRVSGLDDGSVDKSICYANVRT